MRDRKHEMVRQGSVPGLFRRAELGVEARSRERFVRPRNLQPRCSWLKAE